MWEWINWGEVETAELNHYEFIYIFLSMFVLIFSALSISTNDPDKSIGYISIVIGFVGLFIALYSIRSSSKQLTEMEVDYWNARGVDDNRKGSELRKQREYDKATLAYENAIKAFDKADKLDPLYAKSWSNRGNALIAQRKYDEAIEAFRHAIELDSKSPRTWANYGVALYEKGKAFHNQGDFLNALIKHDEAKEAFDTAKEQDTKLSIAWNNEGAALKDKGDIFKKQSGAEGFGHFRSYANNMYDGAIRCYNKAIELDQNFGSFWQNKGVALDAKNNYGDAIQAYDTAIMLDPKNTTTWLNKGNALKALKTYEMHKRAVHAYSKAIEFDPQNLDAWNQKGNALWDLGDYYSNEVLQSLRRCTLATNIHDGLFWLNNSRNLVRESNFNYRESLRSYNMAIDINPRDGMLWFNKGKVLRLLERTDEANVAMAMARELGYMR